MTIATDPASYEAWYHTSRGRWIGDIEFDLLLRLIRPAPGESLLDVGCGTGHFSRRFAQRDLSVAGIDPDSNAIEFAKLQAGDVTYRLAKRADGFQKYHCDGFHEIDGYCLSALTNANSDGSSHSLPPMAR